MFVSCVLGFVVQEASQRSKREGVITMKRLTLGAIPVTALMVLFAFGDSYAQQRAEHGGASAPVATAEVLEVF
jgi:hypothetical protein